MLKKDVINGLAPGPPFDERGDGNVEEQGSGGLVPALASLSIKEDEIARNKAAVSVTDGPENVIPSKNMKMKKKNKNKNKNKNHVLFNSEPEKTPFQV